MSVFCLTTACVRTRLKYSSEPPAILALPSAIPMNLSSTELICSRDTSLSSAMAMPNFWTSRASSCLSTLAASCSPRLMSRMAARCVPASSSLAIRGDPILYDLCRTSRILSHQGSCCRDLLLKARRELDRFALSREAYAVAVDFFDGGRRQPACRLGQRLHQRPQDQECNDQHQGSAGDLLGKLSEPGLLPQRRSVHRPQRHASLERLVEDIQLVAAILFQADGFLDQLCKAFDVGVAHRRGGRLAVGIDLLPVIQHHADIETLQYADRLLHIREGAIDFEITRAALCARTRSRGDGGLCACGRRSHRISRRRSARNRGRTRGARRLIAQGTGYAFRPVAALAHLVAGLFAAHRRLLRIIVLTRLFGDRVVQIRGDGGVYASRSDHRFEQFDDAPLIAFLEFACVFELPGAGG